jgi:hypothetical protein
MDEMPVDAVAAVSWTPGLNPLLGKSLYQFEFEIKLCSEPGTTLFKSSMYITLRVYQPKSALEEIHAPQKGRVGRKRVKLMQGDQTVAGKARPAHRR